jgi:DNA-binding MarR family transcriptional regulator
MMHVDYVDDDTLDELAVLKLVSKNPSIKQKELVEETRKSIATINRRVMKSLQEKQYIRRESGKRYGKWEVLITIE